MRVSDPVRDTERDRLHGVAIALEDAVGAAVSAEAVLAIDVASDAAWAE